MNYTEFLKTKIDKAPVSGFEVDRSEINPVLKPHQVDSVLWAIKGGRRALFESFGLGKTVQELEYCRIIVKRKGGKALIVMPLGVKQEFQRDAVELLGMEKPEYVRTMQEVKNSKTDIVLTNYERVRDGDIDPKYFIATSLDEASVLRSFGSKTYQTFLDKFKGVKYKLVSTATPSPNRYKELIHYGGYLEVMDTGQALTRFFKRDSTKANNLTLYPEREDEFWLWLSSWALFLNKPSDLGYCDEGYSLPPLEIRYHKVTNASEDYNELSFYKPEKELSLMECSREKRDSIDARIKKAKEIIDSEPDNSFIIWHDLEAERHALKKALPEIVNIYGSQDYDIREKHVIDFQNGNIRLFGTKKELSGSGCNFQKHCHRAIFLGIDYEFNDFIQAIHRIYRFLQTKKVVIDIIYTENETKVLDAIKHKWKLHDYMNDRMTEIIHKYGLSNAGIKQLERKMGVGCPEYILLFRKLPTDRSKAYADIPVSKSKQDYTRGQWQLDAHGYWRSSGDRLPTKAEILNTDVSKLQKVYEQYSKHSVYDYKEHIELANKLDETGKLPASFMVIAPAAWSDDVWDDINRMKTLNTTQSQRRQTLHVCPLQIDIVERLINRYSNEGEVVFDPFAGLFTVPYCAVKMNRYGIGTELNNDYFRDGVGYMELADSEKNAPTIFDYFN